MSKIKPIKNGSYKLAQKYSERLGKVRHGLQLKPQHFKEAPKPAEFINGNKVYVVQCRKLVFTYCEFSGSSLQTSYIYDNF